MSAWWGVVDDRETADLLAPGDTVGQGICEAKQWGAVVDNAIIYGSRAAMRRWAQSVLDQLPPDRDTPLVTVDLDRLRTWLADNDVANDPDFEVNVTSICDLMQMIAVDPQTAGWTLGEGVDGLWAGGDDTGDLMAGVELINGPQVGIGDPLLTEELTAAHLALPTVRDPTIAALALVAHRINAAY